MTSFDIVGLGVCTVDHLVRVPHMPRDNQTMPAVNYLRQSGGLASSALAAAARLGARTKIIGRIGDDEAGQHIRRELDDEGVDTAQLLIESGSDSHIAVIVVVSSALPDLGAGGGGRNTSNSKPRYPYGPMILILSITVGQR